MLSFREQTVRYFSRPHEGAPATPVVSSAAWTGADLRDQPSQWTVDWSAEEIEELRQAGQRLLDQGRDMGRVTKADFDLPTAAQKLAAAAREVDQGRGFVLLKGLPVAQWGDALTAMVYWGMAHHLGVPGPQNPQGELLGHVTDYGEQSSDPMVRLYRTTSNINFHCDGADAVGLLCLRTAKSGGQSRIASSVTLFNEIMARRPDLIAILCAPMAMDRRGEEKPGEPPYTMLQPCCFAGGRLSTFYHSEYFRSAVRHGGGAVPSDDQRELLDLYDELAASPDIHLDMWLEPGDFQLISNHTVVHARTAYDDYAEPERRRHLLRLWLSF